MAESPRLVELQEKFEDNPRRYFASLANEYRKAGDLQRAISICGIYLEKQPGHTAGHVVLGQALFASGKTDEATESFATVLGLDPENLIALKCLGDIAQATGDLEAAHENFRKVLTADPRDHDTSGRLKAVEKALKVAALGAADEWIPPRSDEFAIADEAESVLAVDEPAFVQPAFDEPPDKEVDAIAIEEVYEPGGFPQAAPEGSPHQSLEVDNLPALEPPAVHEDLPDDDFVDTLLPSTETEHHAAIAEPVALESAEESLAVPDLMDEADIPPAPPALEDGDAYQYRTAEYDLRNYESAEPETSAASAEMELEADALMDESEAVQFDSSPQQARTGEYSLSGGPFITETVAELYLQQGFTGEALLVYRQLARSKPNDQRIADRIAELEQRLSEEHEVRQAALEPEPEPVRVALPSPPPPPPVAMVDEPDDWFSTAPLPPARSRQTVQEFFAVLGRAKPEVRRKPELSRVTADDIRAAAVITAGFAAFGMEPASPSPKSIPAPAKGESDPQEDVRRFRSWLDGLSDS